MVLAASLRHARTVKKIVCMVTNAVDNHMVVIVRQFFDEVIMVDVLDSRDKENLKLLKRIDLGVTFTKLHCWRLTHYTKCVFMDADTLVTQNIDDMFEGEEITAAPDPGWPDCFNSGVFVFKPSLVTYRALLDFALQEGSFDGGDQGLLNAFFLHWRVQGAKHRLPYTDNCCTHSFYTYVPALKYLGWSVRVIHFIGPNKPWKYTINKNTGGLNIGEYIDSQSLRFLNLWWHYFLTEVQPQIKSFWADRIGELAQIEVRHGPIVNMQRDPSPPGKSMAKWERGEIDYTESERFEKIKEKLEKSLKNKK